jgi:hypothetical protein
MDRHIEIIKAWCRVIAVKDDRAIWYEDGGYKYADILEPGEGWESYSCDSVEMWEMLSEMA